MNRVINVPRNIISTATMGFRKVSHVIFDMDGLLLDTESIYEDVIRQIAKSFGKTYTYETRMKIMGSTEQRTARIAIDELELPLSSEQFLDKFHAMSRRKLPDCKLMKGAERLICHFYNSKVPFCLATSSSEQMVKLKTKNYQELFNLFSHKVCGSSDPEVKHGKPNPDIFLIAAARFPNKPRTENCLVFEDAPNGVAAARAAGMQVVMVPDSRVPTEMRKNATLVLKSLEDFKPEQFGLPPFPK